MTDLNYIACAQKLLGLRPRLFPQFATHNALTVSTVLELAGGDTGFEFQRLHGMGEALYARLGEDRPKLAHRTYAPVGSHRDLLAYLVRRLLENGANSSFVALAADEAIPVAALLRRPADIIGSAGRANHPNIPLPRDLLLPQQRRNSHGIEFGERVALRELLSEIAAKTAPVTAAPMIDGLAVAGTARPAISPIDLTTAIGNRHRGHAGASRRGGRGGARRISALERHAGCETCSDAGQGRRSAGATRGAFHRAVAARGRQDAG